VETGVGVRGPLNISGLFSAGKELLMKIVFTGTPGTDKRHVVRQLAEHISREHGRSVAVIEAERDLRNLGKEKYYDFLNSIPSDRAAREWSSSFKAGLQEWKQLARKNGEPEFTFVSMHLVFQVRSHFYSPMNWSYQDVYSEVVEILGEFEPHLFVNLIDNVYSMQKRVFDYPFRLIELLRWRNVDMLMTDILANLIIKERDRIRENSRISSRFKYERSPVVAVRHPREMLYKLFNEQIRRIYMAYPISKPRQIHRQTGDARLMQQVDSFRDYMRTRFVAFDPVTIDERPLKFLWEEFVQKKNLMLSSKKITKRELLDELQAFISGDIDLVLTEDDLWPTSPDEYAQMLAGPFDHYKTRLGVAPEEPLRLELNAGEVRRAVEEKQIWAGTQKGGEIDNQIVKRDYRLIDQVDCIVIYRPTMKRPSGWDLGGTRLEYNYAKENDKPALVIHDKSDGPLEDPPFNTNVNPFDLLEWSGLDAEDDQERERQQQACFAQAVSRINEKIDHLLAPALRT
jgi:hypothetical protein